MIIKISYIDLSASGTSLRCCFCQGRGNRSNEIPWTWYHGQLKERVGFLCRQHAKSASYLMFSITVSVHEILSLKDINQQSLHNTLYSEDTVEHTVEVCYAWAEHRRVLHEAIGGGNLSRPALVEAMVQGGAEAWEAKEASRERDRHPTSRSQPRRRPSPGLSGRPKGRPRRSLATVGTGLRTASSE